MAASDAPELTDDDVTGPAPAANPPAAAPDAVTQPAPAVAGAPAPDPNTYVQKDAVTGSVVPVAGLTEDATHRGVWRDANGQVAYIGDASAIDPNSNTIDIRGSSDPNTIARYLSHHPDMAAPAPKAGELADADVVGGPASDAGVETPIQKAADIVAQSKPAPLRALAEGTTMGFEPEVVGAATYATTGIKNALEELQGEHPQYSAADAAQAMTQAEHKAQDAYAAAHPVANTALGLTGSLANPINLAGGEFIGAAPTVAGALGRGALVGAGTGALEGAGNAGGDIDNRLKGALSGGATGLVLGGALGAAGRGIARGLPSSAAAVADNSNAAASALDAAGVGQVPPEVQSNISQSIAGGGHPVDSAFRGVAEGLPTPVPLSVGQASGEPGLQLGESNALKGAKGIPARQTAGAFRDTQQAALQANAREIPTQIAGGQELEPGEGGANVSHRLNAARDRAKGIVDARYEAARAAPPASLNQEGRNQVMAGVKYGLKDYDLRNVPKVAREIGNIETALNATKGSEETAPGIPEITSKRGDAMDLSKFSPEARAKILASTGGATPPSGITPSGNAIKDLYDARARLSALSKTYPATVESGAATRVKAQLDLAIDHAVKNDLFTGNTKGVDAWKSAIGARREFGRLFQGNDLIDSLTRRIDRGGEQGTLKVPAEEATNYILGREGLKGLGGINSARDISRLGDVLKRTSPEWQGIKSEVVSRIFAAGNKTVPGTGGTELSGAKLATAWRTAQTKYPGVMQGMFTPTERDLISRFVVTANRATEAVPGGVNASNTFTGIVGMMHRAAPAVVQGLTHIPGVNLAVQAAKDAAANSSIRRATFGATARPAPQATASLFRSGAAGRPSSALAGIAGQEGTSALTQLEGPRR